MDRKLILQFKAFCHKAFNSFYRSRTSIVLACTHWFNFCRNNFIIEIVDQKFQSTWLCCLVFFWFYMRADSWIICKIPRFVDWSDIAWLVCDSYRVWSPVQLPISSMQWKVSRFKQEGWNVIWSSFSNEVWAIQGKDLSSDSLRNCSIDVFLQRQPWLSTCTHLLFKCCF